MALLTWLPSFVSLGLTPNMPESMEEKIPERHVPYVFEKYDVPSSFLINFWESLGVIIFVAILWALFKGLELTSNSKGKPWIASILRKPRVMAQNFLISALFGVYGDLVLFSLIEYRSFVFGWDLSLLSFISSAILLLVMFMSFWYQLKLLLNYQKMKKQGEKHLEEFTKTNEGSQVLFKDLKDYSLAPQLFTFLLSGRDLLFSLLLATMFEYPLVQILLFFILTCLMIAYLLIKKPFQSTFDLIQQLLFEVISFAVSICVLINAVLDTGNYLATSTRTFLGKVMIIFNLIFNFGTALFMLFMIFSLLKEAYAKYKQKSARNIKLNNRLQHPSSEPKSNNTFDQSQISTKKLAMNFDSETDSFHQNSLDSGLSNSELNSSHQQLNCKSNTIPRNAQANSLLQSSNCHQQIINRTGRVLREHPLRHNHQLGPLNVTHSNQINRQRVSRDNSSPNESFKKRGIIRNPENLQIPMRFRR